MMVISWRLPLLLGMLWITACSETPSAALAPIPSDVLRGLNTDAAVLECFGAPPGEPVVLPETALTHRFVDLDNDTLVDLVVDAADDCLAGRSGLRWVYMHRDDGWHLTGRGQSDLAARFRGKWLPKSAVYYPLEPLELGPSTIDAGQCKGLSYDILPAMDGAQLLQLNDSVCELNGARLSVMKISAGKTDCALVLTLYANAAAAQNGSLVSRGQFSRPVCP